MIANNDDLAPEIPDEPVSLRSLQGPSQGGLLNRRARQSRCAAPSLRDAERARPTASKRIVVQLKKLIERRSCSTSVNIATRSVSTCKSG